MMQTNLASRQSCVIRPHGSLNASSAIDFQHQMNTAVAQELNTILIVDMEQVESLDSAGLMALVSGLRLAQALNRRFSICSVSPSIRIIFEVTQLDRVFEIFDSIAAFEAAIA